MIAFKLTKDLQADIFLVCFSIAEPISLYNVRSHWAVEVRRVKALKRENFKSRWENTLLHLSFSVDVSLT